MRMTREPTGNAKVCVWPTDMDRGPELYPNLILFRNKLTQLAHPWTHYGNWAHAVAWDASNIIPRSLSCITVAHSQHPYDI